MNVEAEICYRAVQARDARYDGRFFTCVKTTGIYCRPICPARPPKLENCIFVSSAAAAQEAGFRACLRCKPESSPHLDAWRGTEATVSRVWKLIETGILDDGNVASLAERLDIGERQLRRLFRQHLGASPVTVAQTRRILLAKQLLHQTNLSMIEIAFASGFSSVRRFNETFQRLYGRPPSEIRRRAATPSPSPELSILLPYQPPYEWEAMLRFLAARAIRGVEMIAEETYHRTIEIQGVLGTVHVTHVPEQTSLRATIRMPQLKVLPSIIARLRRQFDLGADPIAISQVLSRDSLLSPFVKAHPGLRVPGAWDGFEVAVRAVLGQQITVKAATDLASHLVAALGRPISSTAAKDGLTHVFPQPEQFRVDGLTTLGLPKRRIETLIHLAERSLCDRQLFDPRSTLEEFVSSMRTLKGIGEWTAQYIAMRGLGESDAFLLGDVGLQRQLSKQGERLSAADLLTRAEQWRPWRAYAVLHLWNSEADVFYHSMKREPEHAFAT